VNSIKKTVPGLLAGKPITEAGKQYKVRSKGVLFTEKLFMNFLVICSSGDKLLQQKLLKQKFVDGCKFGHAYSWFTKDPHFCLTNSRPDSELQSVNQLIS
jgi:hypothetical protein